MKKDSAVILGLALALTGCGGDGDVEKDSVGAATLKQSGVVWGKLTPLEKKTVVAYCLPAQAVDVSPTSVAAEINRLYAGASGSAPRIGAACSQAVTELRARGEAAKREASKRVARASTALSEACPEDLQGVDPEGVAESTEQLAVAYQQSSDRAKDRKYVEAALARLEAGCGPSARLQQALRAPEGSTQPSATLGARTVTGSGPRELGDLVVPRSSDLRWIRGGGAAYLSVTEGRGRLSFLSEARRGYRGVPPGTYRDVWVDSDGPWTIVITPRW